MGASSRSNTHNPLHPYPIQTEATEANEANAADVQTQRAAAAPVTVPPQNPNAGSTTKSLNKGARVRKMNLKCSARNATFKSFPTTSGKFGVQNFRRARNPPSPSFPPSDGYASPKAPLACASQFLDLSMIERHMHHASTSRWSTAWWSNEESQARPLSWSGTRAGPSSQIVASSSTCLPPDRSRSTRRR